VVEHWRSDEIGDRLCVRAEAELEDLFEDGVAVQRKGRTDSAIQESDDLEDGIGSLAGRLVDPGEALEQKNNEIGVRGLLDGGERI
jgi:hypothetical protein